MLIYHPAYDINHCLYRMLLIIECSDQKEFAWDVMRLLDLYVLFPHLLKSITPVPHSLTSFRKTIKSIPNPYESLPNPKRILFDLETIQYTAISNLIGKNIIDIEPFRLKKVTRTKQLIPASLKEAIRNDARTQEEWFKFIVNELPVLEFFGDNGLKKRTGLLEFRYDNQASKRIK